MGTDGETAVAVSAAALAARIVGEKFTSAGWLQRITSPDAVRPLHQGQRLAKAAVPSLTPGLSLDYSPRKERGTVRVTYTLFRVDARGAGAVIDQVARATQVARLAAQAAKALQDEA